MSRLPPATAEWKSEHGLAMWPAAAGRGGDGEDRCRRPSPHHAGEQDAEPDQSDHDQQAADLLGEAGLRARTQATGDEADAEDEAGQNPNKHDTRRNHIAPPIPG